MNVVALPEALKALEKAQDALATGRHDLQAGFTLGAINRSYYCMFYCMSGLLYLHDIHTKSHQGIRAKIFRTRKHSFSSHGNISTSCRPNNRTRPYSILKSFIYTSTKLLQRRIAGAHQ